MKEELSDVEPDYWGLKGSKESEAFGKKTYWLGNDCVREYCSRRLTQGSGDDWITYAFKKFLNPADATSRRVLTVGCGNGSLELTMHHAGLFSRCDAFDYSPGSIQEAKAAASEAAIDSINFFVGDGNSINLEKSAYDVVIFNMSLHHIANLEHMLDEVREALVPDGLLIVHEYVGPDRFAFTLRQREVMEAMLTLIPGQFRKILSGGQKEHPPYPDPLAVKADDPTEAVRSSEILKEVNQRFDIIETNPGGGTVLQFLLDGLAGNFREESRASMKVLRMLIDIEEVLCDVRDLDHDFVLLIAKSKKQA